MSLKQSKQSPPSRVTIMIKGGKQWLSEPLTIIKDEKV